MGRLRSHTRQLFGPLALLVLVPGATVYGLGVLSELWMRYAALGLAGLLLILGVLAPILRWLARRATVTTRRLVVRSGVLVHTRQEVLHARGYAVAVRRAGLQHLFRTGDVAVLAGQDPPLVLRDLPHPHLVAEALQDLVAASAPWFSPPGR